jgi:hypothetical protein
MRVTPVGKKFFKHELGSEFDLPDKAAKVLIRVNKVREVVAEAAPEISTRTGQPKRTYRRRDLQAES